MRLLLICLLVLSACHHAKLGPADAKVKAQSAKFPESSAELSKWVRKNVADFWSFERSHNSLAEFAAAEGMVVGDTHLANFGPVPVRLTSGSSQMRYLDIDFDDAGKAPFAYDFLRLVVTTKATKKGSKIKEMVHAYLRGLTGEGAPVDVPADVQQDLSLTANDYETRTSDDMHKKVGNGKFILKPGKIEAYSGPFTLAQASALLPGYRVMDLASRPTENEDVRIWIYAIDSAGLNRIFELKAYVPTRLSAWGPQEADRSVWADSVRETFWPGVAHGEYELMNVAPLGPVWLREKKLTLIDVPYSNEDKKAVKYVRELAVYDSFILGQLHASQASAAPYVEQLRNPVEQGKFGDAVKAAAKEYLNDVAQRTF